MKDNYASGLDKWLDSVGLLEPLAYILVVAGILMWGFFIFLGLRRLWKVRETVKAIAITFLTSPVLWGWLAFGISLYLGWLAKPPAWTFTVGIIGWLYWLTVRRTP